ncbi:uroporphyrinogen decarboxylase family protein [Planctomycetota bacterium]
MTKKEIVRNTINHKQSEVVPYHIEFTKEAHDNAAAYYDDPDFESKLGNCLLGFSTQPEGAWTEIKSGHWQDQFGVVWDQTVDKDIGVPVNVLVTAENVDSFEFPDPDDPSRYAHYDARMKERPDLYPKSDIGFSLYERAWTLAGMENLLMAMMTDRPFVDRLFDRITEYNLAIIKNCMEFDIDGMGFGDDWGQQHGLLFGGELWRDLIKPRIAQMYAAVKEAGKSVFIHSCGKVDEIFPDLIEVGLDVFNPFQPEVIDPFEIKEQFGDKLTFFGGISTQKTLPYATPEETRKEVEKLLEKVGRNGGYIAAPAHATPADARPENIAAMIDVLKNQ